MKNLKIHLFGAATLLGMMLLTSGINAGDGAPESEDIASTEPSQNFMQRGWEMAKRNPRRAAVAGLGAVGAGLAARRYMQNLNITQNHFNTIEMVIQQLEAEINALNAIIPHNPQFDIFYREWTTATEEPDRKGWRIPTENPKLKGIIINIKDTLENLKLKLEESILGPLHTESGMNPGQQPSHAGRFGKIISAPFRAIHGKYQNWRKPQRNPVLDE